MPASAQSPNTPRSESQPPQAQLPGEEGGILSSGSAKQGDIVVLAQSLALEAAVDDGNGAGGATSGANGAIGANDANIAASPQTPALATPTSRGGQGKSSRRQRNGDRSGGKPASPSTCQRGRPHACSAAASRTCSVPAERFARQLGCLPAHLPACLLLSVATLSARCPYLVRGGGGVGVGEREYPRWVHKVRTPVRNQNQTGWAVMWNMSVVRVGCGRD